MERFRSCAKRDTKVAASPCVPLRIICLQLLEGPLQRPNRALDITQLVEPEEP